MRFVTVPDSPAPFVLQQSATLGTIATDVRHWALPALSSDPAAEDETPLMVLALEEIEARRAAIEWLVEAGLLRLCLA
jgi:hypothetical protein